MVKNDGRSKTCLVYMVAVRKKNDIQNKIGINKHNKWSQCFFDRLS